MPSSRDYVFTKYLPPTDGDVFADELMAAAWGAERIERLQGKPEILYCIMQLERCPNTQRLHFQGYIKMRDRCGFDVVRRHVKWLQSATLSARRGTCDQADAYCRKPESHVAGPYISGIRAAETGNCRTDATGYHNKLKELAAVPGLSWRDASVALAADYCGHHLRAMHSAETLFRQLQQPIRITNFVPRAWQADFLVNIINPITAAVVQPAPSRTVHWIYGATGSEGKSYLGIYLVSNYDAIICGGRLADMQHAYASCQASIVIFDVTRAQADHSNQLYTFAEQLKNGCFMTSKYNSMMVRFRVPHVIFLSNSMYEPGKMSDDRWNLVTV